MKSLKLSVHIPLYLKNKGESKRMKNFKKVCNGFLKLSPKTKIFVHCNKRLKMKNKKIESIFYNFKKSHPFKLTWYCRDLMEKQKNQFDVFIYSEDDIYFSKKNLKYWLRHKNNCIKNKYNLGFLRVETNRKNKKLYSSDQISKSSYYVNLNKKKYFVLHNPYCGFWIYDKDEFNKFITTKWWKFNWSLRSNSGILHIREMAAWGWHGINLNGLDMDRYLATVITIKSNKPDENSFIKHLSNNYADSPSGLFGTFKINEILGKNLKSFKAVTPLNRLLKRIQNIIYYSLRINIKSFFKKTKLHPDLV